MRLISLYDQRKSRSRKTFTGCCRKIKSHSPLYLGKWLEESDLLR